MIFPLLLLTSETHCRDSLLFRDEADSLESPFALVSTSPRPSSSSRILATLRPLLALDSCSFTSHFRPVEISTTKCLCYNLLYFPLWPCSFVPILDLALCSSVALRPGTISSTRAHLLWASAQLRLELSLHWTPVLSHRTFVPWKLARLNVFVTTYFTFRCGLAPLCLFLTWRSAPLQLCALGQSPRLEPIFFGHLLSYAWSIALRFFSLRAEALRLSLFYFGL